MLTCFGAWLRLTNLGDAPITSDEAFTWRLAALPPGEIVAKVSADTAPPLHHLLEAAWVRAFGNSLLAMRALSAMAGALVVPLVYLLVLQGGAAGERAATVGALVSCALAACHPVELGQSRTARMYAIGMLLCCCSTWLFAIALANHRRRRASIAWCAYAPVTACFCLCHHFAALTVLAHVVFVLDKCLRRAHGRHWLRIAGEFPLALAWSACFYSVWIPAAMGQARRVHADFWISSHTWEETVRAVAHWALGRPTPQIGSLALMLAGAGFLAYSGWGCRPIGRLFWLMTVLPWIATIGISTLGGRPLLQERYLAFAHVGLLCLIGATLNRISSNKIRCGAAAAALLLGVAGGDNYFRTMPHGPGGLSHVVEYIAPRYQPGDVIMPRDARTVHRLRYFFHAIGKPNVMIKVCLPISKTAGQLNHVAALSQDEILLTDDDLMQTDCRRIWRICENGRSVEYNRGSWACAESRSFRGLGEDLGEYLVLRCDRRPIATCPCGCDE